MLETEVIFVNKNEAVAVAQNEETTEELIGVLTAISVVSKRLAKKLTLLEQRSAEGSDQSDGQSKTPCSHAD